MGLVQAGRQDGSMSRKAGQAYLSHVDACSMVPAIAPVTCNPRLVFLCVLSIHLVTNGACVSGSSSSCICSCLGLLPLGLQPRCCHCAKSCNRANLHQLLVAGNAALPHQCAADIARAVFSLREAHSGLCQSVSCCKLFCVNQSKHALDHELMLFGALAQGSVSIEVAKKSYTQSAKAGSCLQRLCELRLHHAEPAVLRALPPWPHPAASSLQMS